MQLLNLPSFVWLWKIAAWSMGFTLVAYVCLAVTGFWRFRLRVDRQLSPVWLTRLHIVTGGFMVALVLLLLVIGIVGTIGQFGSLGHSSHLAAGLGVVNLVGLSAWSAVQIRRQRFWARPLHIGTNLLLCIALAWVSLTGWEVVQKYLP
ncbi:MAG: DUF4079 domain-containing protein [Scytolyngbya sp. HA4215-MV1]|nr:DUF4079 domain-containing protein [Scytolyngbya sp. HA4215-MV1]